MKFVGFNCKVIGYVDNKLQVELMDGAVKGIIINANYFTNNSLEAPQFKEGDYGYVVCNKTSAEEIREIGNAFYFLGVMTTDETPTPTEFGRQLIEDWIIDINNFSYIFKNENDEELNINKDSTTLSKGGENKIEITQDLIQFNGGSNGGLVLVEELTEKINNLENQVNDLLSTLMGITITLAPAGTVPFAPFFASITPLVPTQVMEIENSQVTQ